MAKIWPESKFLNFSQNFTKLNMYTKNDEMNLLSEFQLNMTPRSAKMGTPILVRDPQNGGFTKTMNLSFSGIFYKKVFIYHNVQV